MPFPQLDLKDSVLVVVDLQSRLLQAMPSEQAQSTMENAIRLIRGAALLDVPVLATEQYPRGLGSSAAEILEALPPGVVPIEKVDFSCQKVPEFRAALASLERKTVILCGVEAHVCVYQTALDSLAQNFNTVVAADAICSRRPENHVLAMESMRQAGAFISPTESILFEWLGRAGGDAFKEISRMLR